MPRGRRGRRSRRDGGGGGDSFEGMIGPAAGTDPNRAWDWNTFTRDPEITTRTAPSADYAQRVMAAAPLARNNSRSRSRGARRQ